MIGGIGYENAELLYRIGINLFWNDTVDYAIDRIRKKYNVVIRTVPVLTKEGIKYSANITFFDVKNDRIRDIPSHINWQTNIYRVKRRAIKRAAKWILAHKCKKISIKSAKK
jgi:hypothetical protein